MKRPLGQANLPHEPADVFLHVRDTASWQDVYNAAVRVHDECISMWTPPPTVRPPTFRLLETAKRDQGMEEGREKNDEERGEGNGNGGGEDFLTSVGWSTAGELVFLCLGWTGVG